MHDVKYHSVYYYFPPPPPYCYCPFLVAILSRPYSAGVGVRREVGEGGGVGGGGRGGALRAWELGRLGTAL